MTKVKAVICGTVSFNICYQMVFICSCAICDLLHVTCYLNIFSETCYHLYKLIPFACCCMSHNFCFLRRATMPSLMCLSKIHFLPCMSVSRVAHLNPLINDMRNIPRVKFLIQGMLIPMSKHCHI